MKKKLMLMACVLAALTGSESALAQSTDLAPLFTLSSSVRTVKEFTIDYSGKSYAQDSLRSGIQNILCILKGTVSEPYWPTLNIDTLTAISTFNDLYGREVARLDASKDVFKIVKSFLKYHAYNCEDNANQNFSLEQGGEYVLHTVYDFIGIDRLDTVTVYDNPSLRIWGDLEVLTGQDLKVEATYNTGYPYDINRLTGEEYADMTLYRMETDSTGYELYKHRFPLHVKDLEHPLLAGIDSFVVNMEKPEIGLYRMRLETNMEGIDSRDILLRVKDTLRATVTLDKEAYNFKASQPATMHLTMDYGYPHIGITEPDTAPTIRVTAKLFKDEDLKDTLFTDSLLLVSDTLATKDLHYVGDWQLDWKKVDASKLAEDDTTYYLQVLISFNGEEQYTTTIPVGVESFSTAISTFSATLAYDESIYTLSGLRVNSPLPLKPGIYIRNGKKVIINRNKK